MAPIRQNELIRPHHAPSTFLGRRTLFSRPSKASLRALRGGPRLGLLFLCVAILALLLTSFSPSIATSPRGSDQSPVVTATPDASSYLYYNGTIDGNGGTQTSYVPAPANGTVWDLVSAKITITASSPVSGSQNSYLYDSTCTEADVAPAPSACVGVYGPNVDGIANDVMDSGKDGTAIGEGGYASTAPSDVIYTHYEQTIHLNHDMFISFGADLSRGVSSTYYLVFDPEIGDYPSIAFYRWSNPVEPLSSTPKIVTLPSPPTGYYYRAEISASTIDLSSDPGPTRSAEVIEEPSGTVLSLINDWTVRGTGVTEDACGGYSASQTCPSDPAGTATIWDDQIILSAGDSLEARFVGVSGDLGVFAVVLTEYPAAPTAPTGLAVSSSTTSSLTWSWTNPGGDLTADLFFWEAGATCTSPTEADLGAVADSYTLGSLASGSEYCAYVEVVSAGGTSLPSSTATGWTTPANVPGPPTNVTALAENSSAIQLSWLNPNGELSDDLIAQFSGSNCSGTSAVLDLGTVVSSYDILNLSAGTTYSYEVAAVNSLGDGTWSACVSATTVQTAPSAPTNLTATAVSSNTIELVWVNPTGLVSDDLVYTYSGATCTGASVTTDLGSPQESYASIGLAASSTYSYAVQATNYVGAGPISVCVAATTTAAGGLQNVTTALELTATTPLGNEVAGVVVQVDFELESLNFSITIGPSNASGGALYSGVASGTTITNVSLLGANYTLNSYTVLAKQTTVVQLFVVVTLAATSANNTSAGQWVKITEQGLPAGSTWWVSVTGPENELLTCSGTTINIQLENGTYQFAVGSDSDLNATEQAGVLVVPNAPTTLPVNFTNQPAATPGPTSSGPGLTSSQVWQTVELAAAAAAVSSCFVLGTYLSARRRTARARRLRTRAPAAEPDSFPSIAASPALGTSTVAARVGPTAGAVRQPADALRDAMSARFELMRGGNREAVAQLDQKVRLLRARAGIRSPSPTFVGKLRRGGDIAVELFREPSLAGTRWIRGRASGGTRWARTRVSTGTQWVRSRFSAMTRWFRARL